VGSSDRASLRAAGRRTLLYAFKKPSATHQRQRLPRGGGHRVGKGIGQGLVLKRLEALGGGGRRRGQQLQRQLRQQRGGGGGGQQGLAPAAGGLLLRRGGCEVARRWV
jgi:hypothetical protein